MNKSMDAKEKKMSKYLYIYNEIKQMIVDGQLKSNEKLPAIRAFAKDKGVNNSTIIKAYDLLEKEGYLYKIVGKGTFVSHFNINKLNIKESISDELIHFDSGNPSNDIFPVDDFKNAVNLALEDNGCSIFDYDDSLGYEKLRKFLVYYLKSNKIYTSIENLQVISGAQQGIDIVCKALLSYSDVVFVEEPTYSGAIEVFKNRGVKIVSVPMMDDGIDIGILKKKIDKFRPKLFYTMPNFQNPTGISYSKYKKKKLVELAREYDFYILEDDFISDFMFNSEDNTPLRSYDKGEKILYIKSFSKILMPGLRIGIIESPLKLIKDIVSAKHTSDIASPLLIQKSLYCFMKNCNWNNYISNIEKVYFDRYIVSKNYIERLLSDRLKIVKSVGGINFFLKLPSGYSSQTFCSYLLKKGVVITPGTYFFDNPEEDRYFRINIAKPGVKDIKRGLHIISENLDEFFDKYKYK